VSDSVTCLAGLLGVVVVVVVLFVIAVKSAERRARQQRTELTDLLTEFSVSPVSTAARDRMMRFLESTTRVAMPAGFFPAHQEIFSRMVVDRTASVILQWLFEKVEFAPADGPFLGRWFADLIASAAKNHEVQERFVGLFGRLKPRPASLDAAQLYHLALAQVELLKGSPGSKALALFLGRTSYSASRPGRTPTIYDEQAINNDIYARCPSEPV
jgi:hypothetical protein